MEKKKCTKCGEIKVLTDYCAAKHHKDGYASRCRICSNAATLISIRTNPEAHKQRQAKYRQNNREKIRIRSQEFQKNNRERINALARLRSKSIKYREQRTKKYLEKRTWHLVKGITRRTKTPFTKYIVDYMEDLFYKTKICPFTGQPLNKYNSHIDHKIPLSRGGPPLDLANLQWVSEKYNRAKFNDTDEEFARHWKLTWIP